MTGSPTFPRVQAIPEIGRTSLRLDGVELAGYEFGEGGTRPYVFPLIGPSGTCVTRLGHPNPIGHEHHKSVWFGHQSVAGINFWEDQPSSDIRIRHRCVRLYHDGNRWGGLVADLDPGGLKAARFFHHELILVIEPISNGGFALDFQLRLDSSGGVPVDLGKTNFGFLGVRVARTMSEQFGGGRLMDAKGSVGEKGCSASPIHGSTTPGRMLPPRQRGSVSWTIRGIPDTRCAGMSGPTAGWERHSTVNPRTELRTDIPWSCVSIARASGPAKPYGSWSRMGGLRSYTGLFDHSAASGRSGGAREPFAGLRLLQFLAICFGLHLDLLNCHSVKRLVPSVSPCDFSLLKVRFIAACAASGPAPPRGPGQTAASGYPSC